MLAIRDATEDDMAACVEIYNALIDTTTVAWTEEHQTLDQRLDWFRQRREQGHAVLVAEEDGVVVGYAGYGSFRGVGKWSGYRHTVEHTIHIAGSHHGRGLGRELIETLVDRARGDGLHVMVGAIDADNLDSIRFHERLGFVEVARMPEIGWKFGRWLTLVLMQRILDPGDRSGGGGR